MNALSIFVIIFTILLFLSLLSITTYKYISDNKVPTNWIVATSITTFLIVVYYILSYIADWPPFNKQLEPTMEAEHSGSTEEHKIIRPEHSDHTGHTEPEHTEEPGHYIPEPEPEQELKHTKKHVKCCNAHTYKTMPGCNTHAVADEQDYYYQVEGEIYTGFADESLYKAKTGCSGCLDASINNLDNLAIYTKQGHFANVGDEYVCE